MFRLNLILVSCLLLAGCFDLEQRITLNRDGSGAYKISLTAEGAIGEGLKNEILISESKGQVQRETKIINGRTVHTERIRFRQLSDISLGDEDLSLIVHGDNLFGLMPKEATFRRVVKSGDISRSRSPGDADDRAALAAVFGNHTYRFSVSLPGTIVRVAPVKLGGVTIRPEITGDYFRHTVTWNMPLHLMFAADEIVFSVDFEAYGTFSDARSRQG